jgi:hypothetical protein
MMGFSQIKNRRCWRSSYRVDRRTFWNRRDICRRGQICFAAFAIPSCAARPASNHEEPMRGIAPELFDQAIFPIEIGLHRARCDIGALVGAPVAV